MHSEGTAGETVCRDPCALPAAPHMVLCRYGFDDDVYKSLAEMGRIWHLSESRAKKTEEEAVEKLRSAMNAMYNYPQMHQILEIMSTS